MRKKAWVNKLNSRVRHKESLCNVNWDNRRNGRPGTDCEQNSLRYFCTAKGGCHIAGDGVGGWGGTGLHAEAALLAQLLAMRCPSWNAAPLVYISWYFSDAFIDLQRSYGKNDRLAHCFPKTSHKPEALILILPLEPPVGWIKNHFQFSACHFNLKKKDVQEQKRI